MFEQSLSLFLSTWVKTQNDNQGRERSIHD